MNTIDTILKIAKVKDMDSFYKKFPSEEAFMAKYGKEFKKAMKGAKVKKAQGGLNLDITPDVEKPLTLEPWMTDPNHWNVGKSKPNMNNVLGQALPIVGDVVKGFQMLKDEKNKMLEARQWRDVSNVQLQASNLQPERINNQYVRPEDSVITGEEYFPIYGTGAGVLAKDGIHIKPSKRGTFTAAAKKRGKGVQEFASQVMSNKDNYSPAMVKKANFAKNASKWKKAQDGTLLPWDEVGNTTSNILTGIMGEDGGGTIGGSIGKTAGTLIGGPIGGAIGGAIGQVGGQVIGSLINTRPERTKGYLKQAGRNANLMMANAGVQGIHDIYSGYMKDGGKVTGMELDGELQMLENRADVKPISYNPFLSDGGETVQFQGPSHSRGGMDIAFGNTPVEVEGGEPATKMDDNSLVVYGDLTAPGYNKKFKNVVKDIAKKEQKQNNLIERSIKDFESIDVQTPLDKLKVETLQTNIKGATMKQKELAQEKEHLASLQEAINQAADEQNLDASALAKGKIKKAKKSDRNKAQEGDRIYKRDDNLIQRNLNYLRGMWQNSPHSEVLNNLYDNTVGIMDYDQPYIGGIVPASGKVGKVYRPQMRTFRKFNPNIMDDAIKQAESKVVKRTIQDELSSAFGKPASKSTKIGQAATKQSPGQMRMTGKDVNGNPINYQVIEGKIYEVPVSKSSNIPWKEIGYGTAGAVALGLGTYGLSQLPEGSDVDSEGYVTYPNRTIPDFNQQYDFYPPYEQQQVNQLIPLERPAVDEPIVETPVSTEGTGKGSGKTTTKGKETKDTSGMVVAPDVELEDIDNISEIPSPEMVSPRDPNINYGTDNTGGRDNSDLWNTLSSLIPYFKPSDVEGLDPSQIAGELAALSDKEEPVWAQTIQPDLASPYEISLQDQKNEVVAQSRAAQRMAGNNPAAQAMIASQTSDALNKIQGEEFRINQAMKDKVFTENRNMMNQTRFQNLAILDKLYERQSMAKSKTKDTLRNALNSISDKYLKNRFENRTLATYENLYDYRFDDRGRAWYMGRPASFNTEGSDTGQTSIPYDEDYVPRYERDPKTGRERVVGTRRRTKGERISRNGSIVRALKRI